MDTLFQEALDEAHLGLREGGAPIGSVLVIDDSIFGRSHNRHAQQGSVVRHSETDCLENAGRLTAGESQRSVLYSTLSLCDMCSARIFRMGAPESSPGRKPHVLGSAGLPVFPRSGSRCGRRCRMRRTHDRICPRQPGEDIGVWASALRQCLPGWKFSQSVRLRRT